MSTILFFINVFALALDPFAPVSTQIYYDGQKLEHNFSNMQL